AWAGPTAPARRTSTRPVPDSATKTSPLGAVRSVRGCLNPVAYTSTSKPFGTVGSTPSGRGITVAGLAARASGSLTAGGAGRSETRIRRFTPGPSAVQGAKSMSCGSTEPPAEPKDEQAASDATSAIGTARAGSRQEVAGLRGGDGRSGRVPGACMSTSSIVTGAGKGDARPAGSAGVPGRPRGAAPTASPPRSGRAPAPRPGSP